MAFRAAVRRAVSDGGRTVGRRTINRRGARAVADAGAADEIVVFEAQWHATLRNDQRAAAMESLRNALPGFPPRRLGVEFSTFGRHLDIGRAELADIEPDLLRLRRRKDVDELALIRQAIAGTGRMYARAARSSGRGSPSWRFSTSCKPRAWKPSAKC